MAKKIKRLRGQCVVVPSSQAVKPDFLKAMMAFQYGTAEESDAGFEEMKRQAISAEKKKK